MNITSSLAYKLCVSLSLILSISPIYAQNMGAAQTDFDAGVTAYAEERYEDARTLYTKSCDANLAKACYNLGEMLIQDDGNGDTVQARLRYAKACDGGVADACSRLGWMFQSGLGGPENAEQTEFYYDKACDLGEKEACLYQ